MKEIDFDELDRAVSSLMEQRDATQTEPASVPKPTTAASEAPSESSVSVEAKTTVGTNESVSGARSNEEAERTPKETAAIQPRRGRFMDMVHTSSDMRQSSTPAVRKPSRQGVTIAPPAAVNTDKTPSSEQQPQPSSAFDPIMKPASSSDKASPESKPSDADETPESTEAAATSDWPDPIDTALATPTEPTSNDKDTTTDVSSAPSEGDDTDDSHGADKELSVSLDKTDTSSSQSPTTKAAETAVDFSPFISGAKIEKRPLGGDVGDKKPDTEEIDPHELLLGAGIETEKPTPDTTDEVQRPAKPQSQLPEELHDDLMAVEADTTGAASADARSAEKPEVRRNATNETETKSTKQPITGRLPEHTVTPAKSYSGPVSIPQQYKEAPSSTPGEHTPIYDAGHQPLQHPTKKKSGWWAVLAIVLLIVIGGGGAAALYYAGIL